MASILPFWVQNVSCLRKHGQPLCHSKWRFAHYCPQDEEGARADTDMSQEEEDDEENGSLFSSNLCYQASQESSTSVALLKACAKERNLDRGNKIHADVLNSGILREDIYIGCTLIHMYAKCGALGKARQVFEELHLRNIVSWNALIAGYVQHGHGEEAIKLFELMQHQGIFPDAVTFACVLKACGSIGAAETGKEIHDELLGKRLLGGNSVLGNALVDMYAKCGACARAEEVVGELPVRNIVSWTTLISGYCQQGQGQEALNCYERMRGEGLFPDIVTLRCILKACGSIGAADKGLEIHTEIVRRGLFAKDSMQLWKALVDMYAKCGALASAQEAFEELPIKDVVSWTALITGYAQNGHGDEALSCLKKMQAEGVSPNAVTLLCILKACGGVGAAHKGEEIHAGIIKEGLLKEDRVLGNAMVDMYAKCGTLAKAQQVFDELPLHNVVTWTALIAGFSQVGRHAVVLHWFKRMVGNGIQPTMVTFLVVLNSCSRLGFVDEGQMYFESMSRRYGIIPTLAHSTCMVDLFGQAGHFDKAMSVIMKLRSSDFFSVWFALLAACRKWGNVKVGSLAFRQAMRLDEKSTVALMCMRDICASSVGMQEDMDRIFHGDDVLRERKAVQ